MRADQDSAPPRPGSKPSYDPLDTIEQEQWVLGTILSNTDFYRKHVVGELKDYHFSHPFHQDLFREIERRISADLPAHLLDILSSFRHEQLIDQANKTKLADYVRFLVVERNGQLFAVGYLWTIREVYTIKAARALSATLARTGDNRLSPDVAIKEFFEGVDALRAEYQQAEGRTVSRHVGDAVEAFYDHLGEQIKGTVVERRVTTGIHTLDNKLGGFGEGDLVILAGRPGMGKSTLATSITLGAATQPTPQPSLFFSFEMAEPQVAARIIADDIARHRGPPIEYRHFLNPKGLKDHEWHAHWNDIRDAVDRFRQMPIELDCSPGMSISELVARARQMAAKFRKEGQQLSLIVIDYLKYIQASERYRGNRVLEVGEITGSMKGLAKELGIPVILLCQLSRKVEERQDKRPQLSDLRESGDIEQDADVVLFTYRQNYYSHTVSTADHMEVIVAKHRNGPTGTVELKVDMGRSYITDRPVD